MSIEKRITYLFLYVVLCSGCSSTNQQNITNRKPQNAESLSSQKILDFFEEHNLKFDDSNLLPPFKIEAINEKQIVKDKFESKYDSVAKSWLRGHSRRFGRLNNKPGYIGSDVESVFETEKGTYALVKERIYFKDRNSPKTFYLTPLDNSRFLNHKISGYIDYDGEALELNAWTGLWEFYADDTYPVKSNCDESTVTSQDLISIFNQPNVKDNIDFVKSLPKDSLQKFTLIHKSESLQREGVNKDFPRVMRFTTDGSLALTYTCDPSSESYNTLEIMEFNKEKRKFDFLHLSFPMKDRRLADIFSRKSKNMTLNHNSCLGCHGGHDPRPNWNPYFVWPGVYGENDDHFGKKHEKIEFVNFKEKHKDNPCIASLPWPDASKKIDNYYPYIDSSKLMNYHYRPNAHFTIVQSRRNAQRLARKLYELPYWRKIRFDAMKFSLNCKAVGIENNLKNYFGFDQEIDDLKQLSQIFGFYESDWRLNFHKGGPTKVVPEYLEGTKLDFYQTGSWRIKTFLESVLFRDLAKEYPGLKKYDVRINRMTQQFGRKMQCVDEVADKLWLSDSERVEVCNILDQLRPFDVSQVEKIKITPIPVNELNRGFERKPVPDSEKYSPKQGRQIIGQVCLQCHSKILKYNFATSDIVRKQMKYFGYKNYYNKVKEQLGNSKECKMPYAIAGKCLTDKERTSVLFYFRDFIPTKIRRGFPL